MTSSTEPAYRLTDSVQASTLQELQDSFAALAQVSISICDAEGHLLTQPTCAGPLCRLLRDSETGQAACIHSIEAVATAFGNGGQVIAAANALEQTCHAGMIHVGVPIELAGQRLGSIIVGDRPAGQVTHEGISELARQHGLDNEMAQAAAAEVVPITNERQQVTLQCAEALAKAVAQLYRQDLQIRSRVEELTAVYELAGLLSGTEDLQAILDASAKRVAEVMRVKACAIRLLDKASGELILTSRHNLSEAYVNKGPVVLGSNPIDDAAFAGQTVYIADAATDPRLQYPEQARKEGIVSGLCTAMSCRGDTVGVMRVYTGESHRFSLFEISLLRAVASQAAAAVVNARFYAQWRESERYEQHLQYAGEIQRRMIPAEPPQHRYITFAGEYAPRLEVGGDFYDFLDLPWGNVGLCIADVVGKGVPAALMMASVRAALRGHAHTILEINEIIGRVNRHLCRDTLTKEFATLFYGVFSPDAAQFTYCNAGHNPPLLYRAGRFTRLESGGMLIGVTTPQVYERETLALKKGDLLVFYTDGVTEALNFQDQAFGMPRLEDSIRRYAGEGARTLAKQVLWDVRRFAGLAPQTDDVTIVVAEVTSQP